MSWEVHIDWRGETCFVGRLHAAITKPEAHWRGNLSNSHAAI